MKELILIIVGSALVNNIILSQFQGLCPFLGVSKKVDTSIGMGAAVIFVYTLWCWFRCTWSIYRRLPSFW